MLKQIQLERKPDTPGVVLDPQGTLSVTGRSLPENAEQFYRPFIEWLDVYVATGGSDTTVFTLELEYFNSSSVKQILTMLLKLEELDLQGKNVQVVWSYNQDDELMEMKGRELESLVDLKFVMQAYSL